jgi:hypothetical protein
MGGQNLPDAWWWELQGSFDCVGSSCRRSHFAQDDKAFLDGIIFYNGGTQE